MSFGRGSWADSLRARKVKIVDPHWAGQRRRSGRQAETVKDFADGFGWVNGRQDAHSTTAPIAPENVRGKYAAHPFSLRIIPGPTAPFLLCPSRLAHPELLPCRTVGLRHSLGGP